MRGLGILAGIAALATPAMHHMGRTRYIGHRPVRSKWLPHQGEREVTRRLRQADRDRERQALRHPIGVNCGLSRRGRIVVHG